MKNGEKGTPLYHVFTSRKEAFVFKCWHLSLRNPVICVIQFVGVWLHFQNHRRLYAARDAQIYWPNIGTGLFSAC